MDSSTGSGLALIVVGVVSSVVDKDGGLNSESGIPESLLINSPLTLTASSNSCFSCDFDGPVDE